MYTESRLIWPGGVEGKAEEVRVMATEEWLGTSSLILEKMFETPSPSGKGGDAFSLSEKSTKRKIGGGAVSVREFEGN